MSSCARGEPRGKMYNGIVNEWLYLSRKRNMSSATIKRFLRLRGFVQELMVLLPKNPMLYLVESFTSFFFHYRNFDVLFSLGFFEQKTEPHQQHNGQT